MEQDIRQNQYRVLHAGQIQGPFDLDFVEAMVMSGVYPTSVLVQKVGTTSQLPFSQAIGPTSELHLGDGKSVDVADLEPEGAILAPASRVPKSGHQFSPQGGKTDSKPLSIEAKFAWIVCIAGGLFLFWAFREVSSKRTSTPTRAQSVQPIDNSWTRSQPNQAQLAQSNTAISQPVVNIPSYAPPPQLTQNFPASTSNSALPPSSYQTLPSPAKTQAAPVESTQIYRDASGRTYRVPNAAYYSLLSKKTALASEKAKLDQVENEINALGSELGRLRLSLDRTSQYSVDSFNQKVNRFNDMNDRLQDATDAYNQGVDAFNAELARVGTPIY